MNILIKEIVKVDVAAWALEFGVHREDVRKDVKRYFKNSAQMQVDKLGLQKEDKK